MNHATHTYFVTSIILHGTIHMHTDWLHHTIIIIQINIRKQDASSVRFIFQVKINVLHYTHNHTYIYIYIATLASQLDI